MRIAILSDIHGNLEALRAVFKDMKRFKVNKIFCLGDIVGYGPFPARCLSVIQKYSILTLRGNHEDAIADSALEAELTKHALEGVRFSKKQLSDKQIAWINGLCVKAEAPHLNLCLAHGSYVKSSCWSYIYSEDDAFNEIKDAVVRVTLVGHTHNAFVFGNMKGLYSQLPDVLELDVNQKFLINVGSVGQPRDGDCRASYGILEYLDERISYIHRRVFYNIVKTEKAIRKFGISPFLSERLYLGE